MLCILYVGTLPTLGILNIETVPTLCILNVEGIVPPFSSSLKKRCLEYFTWVHSIRNQRCLNEKPFFSIR